MFAISILDRSNVGFAKEALKVDSHIGDSAYAFGAGIFFIGYAVFEVPSNLILHRVGAKIWLSRIMVTWGIASALMMFAHSEISFYILRFIVGVAEAGFSPGVILYSTYWFPARERSQTLGIYYMGLPAALALGSALSGLLMQAMEGLLGLRNWQWMFLVEGLAASAVGIVAFFYLVSRPRDASWLSAGERSALEEAVALDQSTRPNVDHQGAFAALWNLQVARFIAIYFTIQIGIYGVIFYLPSQVAQLTGREIGWRVGLLVAIPWFCALLALRPITRLADRSGKHRQFAIMMVCIAVAGLACSTHAGRVITFLPLLCAAIIGFVVVQPIFWILPTEYLSGTAAASGIALIGAFGNLGGFVAPMLKTAAEKSLHNQHAGMLSLACASAAGAVLLMTMNDEARTHPATAPVTR
jgi:MFS family permease